MTRSIDLERCAVLVQGFLSQSSNSVGAKIKQRQTVINYRNENCKRQPNVTCRVESFGRMCSKFDDRRKKWVIEMGFGGLLHLSGKQLPRTLCYWLMTRIDPETEMFVGLNGEQYRLSASQVQWVLGLPRGPIGLPIKTNAPHQNENPILQKLACGSLTKGILMTLAFMERAEGRWEEEEKDEFKMLFLMLALQMVLCPTQCPRLASDLVHCVPAATTTEKYDWCSLVLQKLMASVRLFARTFDKKGYVTGCGGCTIFVAIFYLDRLQRNPIYWDEWPRIKFWCNEDIRKVSNEDRNGKDGDFGVLGMFNIAYGEEHPRDARDKDIDGDIHAMAAPVLIERSRRISKFPRLMLHEP